MNHILKILILCMLMAISSSKSFAEVTKYYLEFSPSDIDMIFASPEEDIYINGTIRKTGEPVACRMRIRGDGTRQWPKKSLKVVFDNQTLDGKEKINFNAEYEDYTYLNSILSSQIYRASGHPCFEASHAALYLNGKFWGLFVRIENIDEEFLAANKLDPKDDLYKATFDGACLSSYDDIYSLWEKKTNEATGRQNLQDLIDTLNTTNPYKFKDFAIQYFDYDKMVNFISVNLILSNFSTYYHNYYMYQRIQSDNKWYPIPWDMDKTFYKYGLYTDILNSSNYRYPDNPMLEWSFFDTRVKADIRNRITYLLSNHFDYEEMSAKIDSLKSEIRQYVELDSTDNVLSINDWEGYIEKTKSYVKDRPQHLLNQMDYYPSNFRVEKLSKIVTKPPTIRWEASKSPSGRKVTYQLRYNTVNELASGYKKVDSIDALSYTFPQDLPEGRYYFDVLAFDQYIYIDGTDNYNYFDYKKPTENLCNIDSEVRFTKENSPYIIDCDMQISENGKLIVDPGVDIYITKDHIVHVNGSVQIDGTEDSQVLICSVDKEGYRNKIKLYEGASLSLKHCNLTDISFFSQKAEVSLKNFSQQFTFESTDNLFPFIDCYWSDFEVVNGHFYRNTVGLDGIIFWNSKVVVEDCLFENVRDATELVVCKDSKVLNNTYISSGDDAIDFNGGSNIEVAYNKIFNAFDKGISIGNNNDTLATNFKVHHNIIVGCGMGTSFKDNSQVDYYNNTLYNNTIPLEALRMGKELVKVRNTIFYQNEPMPQESLDKLHFSYNISDIELFTGQSNQKTNALMLAPDKGDYSLLPNSPAIDAGDPASPKDDDGTRADIGALQFSHAQAKIVINEIHYNQDDILISGDWIELYNNSYSAADLSGWYLSDSDDNHKFVLPKGTILKSHGYYVLVEQSTKFRNSYPDISNYIGDLGFGFSGSGEMVRLYDATNNLVDFVDYSDSDPWPTEPDGDGYTLSLIDPDYDNALPQSWYASEEKYGTPGKANNSNDILELFAEHGYKIYPIPATEDLIVESESNLELSKVVISDCLGKVLDLPQNIESPNKLSFKLDALATGIYNIVIYNGNNQISGRFIKVK